MAKHRQIPVPQKASGQLAALHQQLQMAWATLHQGHFTQAMAMFSVLASQAQVQAQAQLGLAHIEWQQGRLPEALQWAEKAAAHADAPVEVQVALCRLLRFNGQADLAIEKGSLALAKWPQSVDLVLAVALAQRDAGLNDVAEQTYRQALTWAPDDPGLTHNLSNLLQVKGELDEAAAGYAKVLTTQPGHVPALFELANVRYKQGQMDDAAAGYHQVLAINPAMAAAWRGVGLIYEESDPAKALHAFEQCLNCDLAQPDVLLRFAKLAVDQGQHQHALVAARQLTALDPQDARAWYLCAMYARVLGQTDDSLQAATRVLALDAQTPVDQRIRIEALYLQAMANLDVRRLDLALQQAQELFECATEVSQQATAHQLRAAIHLAAGRLRETIKDYEAAIAHDPTWFHPHVAFCAASQYADFFNAEQLRDLAVKLMQSFNVPATAFESAQVPFDNAKQADKVLRVGYVSGDLRQHSCAYFIEALWRSHDASQVQVIAYANTEQADETTARLRAHCHEWHTVSHLDGEAFRQQVRNDKVDILIDLSGFTDGSKVASLAVRAAPIQCQWLGYLGTTALASMDYRITDHWVNPASEPSVDTEAHVRLDRPYLCYQPDPRAPQPAPLPMIKQGYPTFGSFNVLQKISDTCVSQWVAVLKAVPTARLLLKTRALQTPEVKRDLLARFADHGIDPSRVECAEWVVEQTHHLDMYSRVDVALDTFPYNGVTTTCEALWMGVPVVSRFSDRSASRQGLTLLNAVGLPELAVDSEQAFVDACVRLVADPQQLAETRAGLRERMANCPLVDSADFARHMERALRQIWQTYCATAPEDNGKALMLVL